MGLLHVYFTAATDEHAATAVEHGPAQSGFDAVDLPDVDPSTTLASVEATLLGVDPEIVEARPRFADTIADTGSSWIFTVTDELRQALAAAADPRFAELAVVAVDEYEQDRGAFEDDEREFALNALTGLFKDLSDLSRRAVADDHRLYAWVSL